MRLYHPSNLVPPCHPLIPVLLVVLVALVDPLDLVVQEQVAVEVWVEVVDLAVPADMDRAGNMMEDLSQSYRIHLSREDILFVVGEDHSSSFLTPTILI